MLSLFMSASTFTPTPTRVSRSVARATSIATCVASAEDEALLVASNKVVTIARRFGRAQGQGAQEWVEQAVKGGDARAESLTSMQIALFEECSLDDESGECRELSVAMQDMVSAVEKRSQTSFYEDGILKPSSLQYAFGASPVQTAATKLRGAASKFGEVLQCCINSSHRVYSRPVTLKPVCQSTPCGPLCPSNSCGPRCPLTPCVAIGPEQQSVADAWIKKTAGGDLSSASALLEEQVLHPIPNPSLRQGARLVTRHA
jgi:hypothetical protein